MQAVEKFQEVRAPRVRAVLELAEGDPTRQAVIEQEFMPAALGAVQ